MSITFSSTCSVAIVPELSDDASFEIPDSDLKFEFMRSSGAGGQNVNVTDSAVRWDNKFHIRCPKFRFKAEIY